MDEHIGGAYSGAAPGKAEAGEVFSEPVHDRLFLAGEHVHRHYMATVHGAYETGLDAAHKAAAARASQLGQKTPCGCPPKLVDFLPQASYIGWNNDQTSTHGNFNRCRGIVMKVVEARVRGGRGHGPGSQGPAQHRRRGPTPPDLDELLQRGKDSLKNVLPVGGRGSWLLPLALFGGILGL